MTKFGYSSPVMALIELTKFGCYGRSSLATGALLSNGAPSEPILTKFGYSCPVMTRGRARASRRVIRRQLSFIGHLVRSDALECIVLTKDCTAGQRTRGRPRYSLWDNLKRWLHKDYDELLVNMCDRRMWRAMIADAAKQYSTP